jgi:hypothetical protein
MGTGPLGDGSLTRALSGFTDPSTFRLSFFPLLAAFLALFVISNFSAPKNEAGISKLDFWLVNRTFLLPWTQRICRQRGPQRDRGRVGP